MSLTFQILIVVGAVVMVAVMLYQVRNNPPHEKGDEMLDRPRRRGDEPVCFRSKPSTQERAEFDCYHCKHIDRCFK